MELDARISVKGWDTGRILYTVFIFIFLFEL